MTLSDWASSEPDTAIIRLLIGTLYLALQNVPSFTYPSSEMT
jgi:hypothetical protein